MGKLPAYLHYAKDWLTDTNLCRCSKAAKGVWIDILDVMFLNVIRGVACTEDEIAWTDIEIAQAIGGDVIANIESINELLAKGVCRRNKTGAIYSKRMVADEKERTLAKERMRKMRRSANVTTVVTPMLRPCSGTANANSISCIDSTNSNNLFTNESVHAERAPPKKRKTFQPPSPEEVATYCAERQNSVNPDIWFSYYESNGWKVGRNSMKDWKAAIRYWEMNSNGHHAKSNSDYDIHREVEKAKRNMAARGTG
jgi:hypothetical protein